MYKFASTKTCLPAVSLTMQGKHISGIRYHATIDCVLSCCEGKARGASFKLQLQSFPRTVNSCLADWIVWRMRILRIEMVSA